MSAALFRKEMFLTVILSLIVTSNLRSQGKLLWGKQLGSEKAEYIMNHIIDQKGNIYVSGTTSGNMDGLSFGKEDGFLTKLDSSGSVKWTKQFGTLESEDIQWCAIDKSGNVYITGSTKGKLSEVNFGAEDIFVVKYSPDGQLDWRLQYGTDSTDIGKGIFVDSNGDIFVTGLTTGKFGKSAFGKSDGFIMKIDSKGKQQFVLQFGTSGDDCSNAITGSNSTVYLCGITWGDMSNGNKGFIDGFVLKLSGDGSLTSSYQFGSEGFDIPMAISVDDMNNIYVGGSTSGNFGSSQIGEGDCFLIKMDNNGNIAWNKQFGTTKNDGVRSIEINRKAYNILVSGVQSLPPAQAFVKIFNKSGDNLWSTNFETDFKGADASGKAVRMDDKGNIYHSGLTQSSIFHPLIGEADFYIVKIRADKR